MNGVRVKLYCESTALVLDDGADARFTGRLHAARAARGDGAHGLLDGVGGRQIQRVRQHHVLRHVARARLLQRRDVREHDREELMRTRVEWGLNGWKEAEGTHAAVERGRGGRIHA
eukprot:3744795-Rhodomonas_salina.4